MLNNLMLSLLAASTKMALALPSLQQRADPKPLFTTAEPFKTSFDHVELAKGNDAGVNLTAVEMAFALADETWLVKKKFKNWSADSVVVKVGIKNIIDCTFQEETVKFADIDNTYSTKALWPGAIARGIVQLGDGSLYDVAEVSKTGKLPGIRIDRLIRMISCGGNEFQTLGPIGVDTEEALSQWTNEWKDKVKPGMAVVVQTKDQTKKLIKSYTYAVKYDPASGEVEVHDPAIGTKVERVQLKDVLPDLEWVYVTSLPDLQ